MKTVLVTGDTGFFGSHLVPFLRSKKFSVVGLSRKHSASSYKTIDFDLSSGIPNIAGIDFIVHLASDTTGSDKSRAINVDGTRNMLELGKAAGIKSFVYASTGGVYGFGNRPFKETDSPRPENDYTKTKHEAENLCREYSGHFNVSVLRYFFPYGPAKNSERLISRLIKKVTEGDTIELNDGGKPVMNPVFVSDAAEATTSAINSKGFEIFNIGGTEQTSVLDLVNLIEKHTGEKALVRYNGKKSGDMTGDIAKAKRILSFRPKVGLEEGIRKITQ